MHFHFRGEIPASKSILNRLLVIQSFGKNLEIRGDSKCDDVLKMRSALQSVLAANGEAADCGAAGTTFRFLMARASRIQGRHTLTGTEKLLSRPHDDLIVALQQLGVFVARTDSTLIVDSHGWKKPTQPLRLDRSKSSQFLSAIVLNAWGLEFNLEIEFLNNEVSASQGYWDMTESLVQQAGLKLDVTDHGVTIRRSSRVQETTIEAEPDLSSAFSVMAMAAAGGVAEIQNYPGTSLQPDSIFPQVLSSMGAHVSQKNNFLRVAHAPLRAVSRNLQSGPDLFPVLAVLCAMATGTSKLFGAPHLVHKESNRILEVEKLLTGLGCRVQVQPDGLIIEGLGGSFAASPQGWQFDPREDHRLAMAAGVAQVAGARFDILHPEVVSKSFPDFWKIQNNFLKQT